MSEKIAVVTDSTSDLSKEILKEKNIESFPLKIIYSDREYRDRVNIQPQEVYDSFEKEIPSTSMPGPEEIKNKYLELKDKGFTHIISIHISSGLSGTYNTCKMASNEIEGVTIELIDSKMLSMGLGRLVLYAQELVDKGEDSFDSIVEMVKNKIDRIDLYFVVSTLKYLKKGGRIGKVKGTIAELLNIKPIISIDEEGKYYTFDKVRSRKKSINRLIDLAKEKINDGICFVDVMHADAKKEASSILDKLKDLNNVKEASLGEISPAMVVHSGPGLIGVCITKE
ncbi:MAG: DegV family protein [Halanaerobiales bacterium]|nr:DegV family protein [Halanaerobiales bacterium]